MAYAQTLVVWTPHALTHVVWKKYALTLCIWKKYALTLCVWKVYATGLIVGEPREWALCEILLWKEEGPNPTKNV